MTRYGYAVMNVTLREEDIRTNRGMRKATFEDRGLEYAGTLAVQNCRDLKRIIEWNLDHGIYYYRIGSDLLPWFSQYELDDLPNATEIHRLFEEIGTLAREHDLRLTFHPGHFVKLASTDEGVVERSLTDLENHGALCDAMDLSRTPYNAINIHIGAHYGDKETTGKRFCEHFQRLSQSVRHRLTVENDDTESLWSIPELIEAVHDRIDVPITYDELHHQFTSRGLTRQEAITRATATWDTTPVIHYSESRRLHEADPSIRPQNHSDYVAGPIRTYETGADVMIEAKKKEKAVFRYCESTKMRSGSDTCSR
ncbi:UV DNA damage repair endonuclease UvsE [Halocatena pleomorpha]|uniref:UV DNA damage repair endonuclease UvsE n=1 Tax=Halocatena pleomorpha TaxID=1785090 RepID=A0A3P3R8N4_9EURY|nr:UV DNA damage repair endonuclease UvsE [Halocatena pleomorpha]RRJ29398.1 UV DNA damage repair endonuclease UvsE [Halocatena pleomorpha]